MVLPVLQPLVLRIGVVEHLRLEARVRGVALKRRAQREAVVRAGRQLELEPQLEVGVLILREEVRAAGLADDRALAVDRFDLVALRVADPAREIGAVEEHDETIGLLLRGVDGDGLRRDGGGRLDGGRAGEQEREAGEGRVHVRKCKEFCGGAHPAWRYHRFFGRSRIRSHIRH